MAIFISKEEILRQTDGGLQVIFKIYPQSVGCEDQKKKFKAHDEKTPSAKLKRQQDGTWVVTDFGGDGRGKNAITLVMEEKNLSFYEACQWIAAEFGLEGENGKVARQFKWESRPATTDEPDGQMIFCRRKFTVDELRVMFAESLMIWIETANRHNANSKDPDKVYERCYEVLKRYGWSALESYSHTIKGKTHTYYSSENYPIFLMEDGEFCKLYKPKEREKQYRFLYYPVGKFPKDHVWGLKQALERYQQIVKEHADEKEEPTDEQAGKKRPEKLPKHEHIIHVSGERDSMNVALMGYYPVWQNSETKGFSRALFKELSRIAHNVYNLPDIDNTGLEQGIKAALEHDTLKTILLPSELLNERDWRGNSCKDLRDFLGMKDKRKKDFDGLVKIARSCRFYDQVINRDKNGKVWTDWEINSVNLHFFLWCSGYRKLKNDAVKEGYQYVHLDGHIVKEVEPKHIRNFVKEYLERNYAEHKLLNKFLRSTILNDSAMEYLQEIEIDFTDHSRQHQILFLKNEIWEINPDGVSKIARKDAKRKGFYVWENEVIPHRVELLEPYFSFSSNIESRQIEAHILRSDCLFFQYLIATCRIHWRKEEEKLAGWKPEEVNQYWLENKCNLDGENLPLSEDLKIEQRRHLANKIFAIGYLLHRYKDPSRPWGVYAMDGRLSEEGASFGRSGKSLLFKAIRQLISTKTIPGRNADITRNPHIYDGVSKHTDLILVDDCNEYLKYDFFFTALTDTLPVNAKFIREFEIAYSESPKFAFTSNFALKNPDPSLLARLIFTVFSDFFHEKTEETDYNETRTPASWLGKNLFQSDFTESDWNQFLNFCAQCIHFYLNSNQKVNPPMAEVNLRNQKAMMGDVFYEWAEVYFSKEAGRLNRLLIREEILDDFNKENNAKWQTRKLSQAIKAFVKTKNAIHGNYNLNPTELQNQDGRIVRKNPANGKAADCIYIQTEKKINESFGSFNTGDSFESSMDQIPEI